MDQSDRIAEFDRFKQDEINILVASDVAARGLDVKGVSHVINFDVPWQPDDYIHRIGRTGRAGMKGIAITLAAPSDGEQVAAIEKLTGTKIARVGAVQEAAAPVEATAEREPRESREREPRESREREPRRGRRDRKPRPERSETREAEASRPAPKEERKPAPRAEPEPKADEADDGWNGPLPSFLSIRAD
jgi:superfamily II DNA/RNA helicase